jgi:electron transfer DM13
MRRRGTPCSRPSATGRSGRPLDWRVWRGVPRHPVLAAVGGLLGAGLVVFVLVWFEPQQLFIEKTVNESPPAAAITSPGPAEPAPPADEQPDVPLAGVVASGSFRSLEHGTSGKVLLIRGSDGTVTLRLEDLDTSNGPDLRVFLSEVPASDDWHAYGERFVDLGALKGNRGNQNYSVPAGTDLSKYRSAVIWCRRFKVGFGVAGLTA